MRSSPVVGEIKTVLSRCGEDRYPVGRAQFIQLAFRCKAHTGEVSKLQVNVVEHIRDKTLGSRSMGDWLGGHNSAGTLCRIQPRSCGEISRPLDFKLRDNLRLASVEDLKVLLMKIADTVSLSVADHGAYHD